MAVQTKILTKTLDGSSQPIAPVGSGSGDSAELTGQVGTLALGKAGDIWSRAYGPLVYAYVAEEDAKYGTLVEGKGIVVNGNDVANVQPMFAAEDTLRAGQTGSFMVAGAAVVPADAVEDILAAMNGRVILGAGDTTGVVVVEVNGFKAAEGSQG